MNIRSSPYPWVTVTDAIKNATRTSLLLWLRDARRWVCILSLAATTAVTPAATAQQRDQIRITGSSSVYPFATIVAEEFGRTTLFRTPIVEAIGTGGGFELFCGGLGSSFPDIVNASRRIKVSEFDNCQQNGVSEIVEIRFGRDGVVVANTKIGPQMTLTLKDIFLALAAQIPAEALTTTAVAGDSAKAGALIANPFRSWDEINPDLPALAIKVLGPPPTSGTRDAFNELIMMRGCSALPTLRRLQQTEPERQQRACQSIREDGLFIDSGENDNLIVQKLQADPRALGIFAFSFLDQNSDVLQPTLLATQTDGPIAPSVESILDDIYPAYRDLYFYVKKQHLSLVPGIEDYIRAFLSEESIGDFGYLTDRGLIPLRPYQRDGLREAISAFPILVGGDLAPSSRGAP